MHWIWRLVIVIWLTSVVAMYLVAMADRLPPWMYSIKNRRANRRKKDGSDKG